MLTKLADAVKVALESKYFESLYVTADGQANSFITTKDLRPDILFFKTAHILFKAESHMDEDKAYSDHLGQVAQYALAPKTVQPMHRYIPVFFLYGCQLDLLVLTNSGYYKTNIGPVLYDNADFRLTETRLVTERPFIDSSPCVIIAPTTTYLTI
ncbi:hypothetical protein GGI03_000019 [Coemansia sp. RSA 2337]|nr:hypothetical protein GGI03_000019 [Coemansia sp. RSA 2337]